MPLISSKALRKPNNPRPRPRPRTKPSPTTTHARKLLALLLVLATPSLADDASTSPLGACDRAAVAAEAEWHLPAGLLAAIGAVESGRGDLGSPRPVAWPWSIDADGRDHNPPSKALAISTVRALRAAGARYIDVGCFQVDLTYHADAFASLDEAFDPPANAHAAARILTASRLSGGSWERAIALYHSAAPVSGARYLQHVQAVWPWARARSAAIAENGPASYAALVPPDASLVRVLSGTSPAPDDGPGGLPVVILPRDPRAVLQWTAAPVPDLPVVLNPPPNAAPKARGARTPN